MAGLENVVVEGEDGPDEVEGRVEDVGEVVAEGVVVGVVGAEGDAVAFGVGGRGEVFLLEWISGLRLCELFWAERVLPRLDFPLACQGTIGSRS